jgi:hypothetical protein
MTEADADALRNVLEHADEPTRKLLLRQVEIIESYVERMNGLPFGPEFLALQQQMIEEHATASKAYWLELSGRQR